MNDHPLAHRAETLRLARVLGVEPRELDFLAEAPTAALAEVRGAVLDRLLERSRHEFERAVALADKVPRGLAATLAQRAMGPVLGGRAAALLDADTAAALAERLPAEFLADVATHVDLRHVGPLIGGIPTDTMGGAGRVLRKREEWIVLSAFVGFVPDAKLEELLELFDGEALLRAGFVIEDTSRLDPVVALLPEKRLDELLDAAHEHALWPAAIALVGHLGAKQRQRVIAAIERQPAGRLDELLAAAEENGLWAEVIVVAAEVDPQGGEDLVMGAVERLSPSARESLATVLREDDELRATVADFIARAPAELRALVDA